MKVPNISAIWNQGKEKVNNKNGRNSIIICHQITNSRNKHNPLQLMCLCKHLVHMQCLLQQITNSACRLNKFFQNTLVHFLIPVIQYLSQNQIESYQSIVQGASLLAEEHFISPLALTTCSSIEQSNFTHMILKSHLNQSKSNLINQN